MLLVVVFTSRVCHQHPSTHQHTMLKRTPSMIPTPFDSPRPPLPSPLPSSTMDTASVHVAPSTTILEIYETLRSQLGLSVVPSTAGREAVVAATQVMAGISVNHFTPLHLGLFLARVASI